MAAPLAMPAISNATSSSPSKATMPASGRTQRRLSVDERGRAPAHRLGPGEGADDRGDRLGEHVGGRRGPASRSTAKQTPSRSTSWSCVEAGLAQEAFERLRRRAGARALELLADRLGLRRQAAGDQREAARRRHRSRSRRREAGRAELLARTAARDRRAPWPASARGFPRRGVRGGSRRSSADHSGVLRRPVVGIRSSPSRPRSAPLARSRTRPM